MGLQTLLHRRFTPPEDLPQPIALRLQHLEQLATAREQRLELLGLRIRQRADLRPDALREQREQIGVDPIRLGELSRRFGKVAHLPRIHHHDRQIRRGKCRDTQELVPTGRFEDNQLRAIPADTLYQRAHAPLVILHGPPLSPRARGDHQLPFGNIDPDEHASSPRVRRVARPGPHSGSSDLGPRNCSGCATCDPRRCSG
jgi:hypothetical protein